MFAPFINVFTRIRMVSCQGFYMTWCRSFYAKPGFFIELSLTLQTDFAARWCLWFLTMILLSNKFVHPSITTWLLHVHVASFPFVVPQALVVHVT